MALDAMTWACLLLTAGADGPAAWHMKTTRIGIPITIKAERREEIRELQLYASRDEGKSWELVSKVKPDKDKFTYDAPGDGTYWFSVAVVDQKGRQNPPDVMKAPVGQRIVVDTVKPEVRIATAERHGDEIVVRWEARDEHADPATLKLEYRVPDAPASLWTPVPTTPGLTGQASFRPGSTGPVTVRVQLQDLAKNVGQAQTEVAGTAGPAQVAVPVAPPTNLVMDTPPPPPQVVSDWKTTPNGASASPVTPIRTAEPLDMAPPPAPAPLVEATPVSNPNPRNQVLAYSPSAPGVPSGDVTPPTPERPAAVPGTPPGVQVVNKRQLKLDFEVAKFGPSGLGGVDVYVTTDDGRTWERQPGVPNVAFPPPGERTGGPVRGSVMVQLGREGVAYGFCLVVKSRAGLGKPPPKSGDAPAIRVELDATLPEAELYRPQADPSRRDALMLTWKASDRNLTATPVSLEWAEHKEGPWAFIGGPELPNTGRHSWQVPANVPPSVYLRLTVRDTAGNTAVAQTNEPVLVDLTVPEVSVITLGGAAH